MDAPLDTLVVGAGISGLAYAHARLAARPEERLVVLEASERAGGLVRTRAHEGFRYEEGPEALPGGARTVRALCAELELAVEEAPPAAANRYLALDGKLRAVPSSLEDVATSRILSFGAKLRLLAEATRARDEGLDGSIADFARHRFGEEALARVVAPLVAGIHAGDPEQLSLRACFPDVARMVAEHGSLTSALKARAKAKGKAPGARGGALGGTAWKPAAGMESLVLALARALGPRVRLASPVRAITRRPEAWEVVAASGERLSAARVVLAVPLAAARTLLATPAPAAADALASMQAESLVSIVHAYIRADVAHPLDGFGYLAPKRPGVPVLGTLFSSSTSPSAAPPERVLLRSLLGGAVHPEALDLADDALVAQATGDAAALLGIHAAPLFTRVARYREVIPRLDLEHPARRERLAAGLPPGLAVLGNFTRGIGLESLVSEARALARGS